MSSEELNIRRIRKGIGWVYPELRWLSQRQAKSATSKRDKLLKSLSANVKHSFMGSKIHTGKLSPGCLMCGRGYWSCIFINALCTANCFYCPQDRNLEREISPYEDIVFENPRDYISYLEKFNIKGVGFSGGEPLLVFDRLSAYIKEIRERLGKKIYLWIYTNGALATKNNITRLKNIGLDEIRFNISANNYDLRPVELAAGIMDTVTVEIPSIPEDQPILKKKLIEMQRVGVKHLNLHQLQTSSFSYKSFIQRGYTFLHQPDIPVFESEIAALEIIGYALDKRIALPINYCTSMYKDRFQNRGRRWRRGLLVKSDFEELTGSKYIRKLSVQDSPAGIKKILKAMRENRCRQGLWALNAAKTEIYIHSSLLKHIDFSKYNLSVSYFKPKLKKALDSEEGACEISLSPDKKIFIEKELLARKKFSGEAAIKAFQKLFIKNASSSKKALNHFYSNQPLKTKTDLNGFKKEIENLLSLKKSERLETGFPKVY